MEHAQLELNQALWKAVKEADVERVEVLLNQGADPLGSLDENDLVQCVLEELFYDASYDEEPDERKLQLTSLIATISVVGLLLLVILEIALGWNYFKLLLETVERYIVVGVLCYTSPLAYSMGASKVTVPVFRSWCHMVGSQLLLLVLNVWFLRGFNSSMCAYIGNGGALIWVCIRTRVLPYVLAVQLKQGFTILSYWNTGTV